MILTKKMLSIFLLLFLASPCSFSAPVEVESWDGICSTHPLNEEMPYLIKKFGKEYADKIKIMVNENLYWKKIGLANTIDAIEGLEGKIVKRFDKEGCNTLVESRYNESPLFIYMEFSGLKVNSYRCEDVALEAIRIGRMVGGQPVMDKEFREFMGKVDKTLSQDTFKKYNNISAKVAAKKGIDQQMVKLDILQNTMQECAKSLDSYFEDILKKNINRVR